jgi:hypothetical protein
VERRFVSGQSRSEAQALPLVTAERALVPPREVGACPASWLEASWPSACSSSSSIGAADSEPDGRGPAPGQRSATGLLEDLPRPADLSLVWFDPSGTLTGITGPGREVRSIFRGLGWRCRGGRRKLQRIRDPGSRDPLAATPGSSAAEQGKVSWLLTRSRCARSGSFTSLRLTLGWTRPSSPRADAFRRALGRVVAHGDHAIAPGLPCGRRADETAFSRNFLWARCLRRRALCGGLPHPPDRARASSGRGQRPLRAGPGPPPVVGPGCAEADRKRALGRPTVSRK